MSQSAKMLDLQQRQLAMQQKEAQMRAQGMRAPLPPSPSPPSPLPPVALPVMAAGARPPSLPPPVPTSKPRRREPQPLGEAGELPVGSKCSLDSPAGCNSPTWGWPGAAVIWSLSPNTDP